MPSLAAALFVYISAAAAQTTVVPAAPPSPQPSSVNVLPLVTGTPGPGSATIEEACEPRILEAPSSVPAAGGAVEIRYAISSARGCEKPPVAASGFWLQPAEGSPGVLRFTAAPNDEAEPRRANVVFGSWSTLIIQAGLPVVQAASAPGRLVFGVDRGGRIKTQTLRVWMEHDDGSQGTLALSSSAPWLKLGKQQTRKGGAIQTQVSIDASVLPPVGRVEAAILATSSQPGRAAMRIPVVVERGELR